MRQAVDATGALVAPAAFTRLCEGSHVVSARVDLLSRGDLVHENIPVSAGTVTVDRRAAHRTRASGLTFPAPPGGVPTVAGGHLAPVGWELRVWRGAAVPGTDDFWWVALGTLPIWSSSVDADGVVTCEAWDRSKLVAKLPLRYVHTFSPAFLLEEWVEDLVIARTLPWLPPGDYAGARHPGTLITHERGSDPWKITTDAAVSVGYEAFFDSYGLLRWRPEPDLSTIDPVRTVAEGEGGTLIDASANLDREPVANAIRVVSTNAATGGEWVGYAEDTDPTSSTYVGGDFGYQLVEFRDDFAASQAAVDAAAAARLAANKGIVRSASHDSVPNPLIEPGDAELVIRGAMGINEVMLVDAQTIGLGAAAVQRHETRARQI